MDTSVVNGYNVGRRTFVRWDGQSCPMGTEADSNRIIGWFANKFNMATGWTVSTLDEFDMQWFADQGVSTENVFRIASEKGMSVAKFDFLRGRVAFFDNEHYENTDQIKFQKFYVYDRFYFDNAPVMGNDYIWQGEQN